MNPTEGSKPLSTDQKRALLKRLLTEKINSSARTHPLSHGQRALWFVHRLLPDSPAYHVALTARLRTALRIAAFERALLRLIERHAALRTVFIEQGGEPRQRSLRAAAGSFRQVEVPAGEARLREAVMADYRRPFDLRQGLFRVTLFRTPERNEVLLVTVHHLVCDAWSVHILFEDLRSFYEGELRNAPVELPAVQAEYPDFIAAEQELLESPSGTELWNYWAGVLAGPLPILQLPAAAPGAPAAAARCGSLPVALDAELIRALRELARVHHATLYMVLLAALQVLLCRYCGQNDILIGSPASGRNQSRWMGVIGYFINLLPIRADVSGHPTFAEHLARTREAVLGALAHQEYPFPLMVERLRPLRKNPRSPMIQVMFNLVASPRGSGPAALFAGCPDPAGVPFGNTILEPYPITQQESQFELVLEMMEAGGLVAGSLKYNQERIDSGTAAFLLAHYRGILAGAIADANLPIWHTQTRTASADSDRDDMVL